MRARTFLPTGLILTLLACGGGGGDEQNPPPPPPPAGSGLDVRPNNQTCLAPDRTAASSTVSTPRAFSNLIFASPVAMMQAPSDSSRWFLVEQQGLIRVFNNNPAVTQAQVGTFLDIRG